MKTMGWVGALVAMLLLSMSPTTALAGSYGVRHHHHWRYAHGHSWHGRRHIIVLQHAFPAPAPVGWLTCCT